MKLDSTDKLFEAICDINQYKPILLQDEGGVAAKPPKQPCDTEFKTKGTSGKMHYTGNLTNAQALMVILNAYGDAHTKAKAFCMLMGDDECKKAEFVRYDEYDVSFGTDDGKKWVQVDLKVVWKCVKK